jgi:hypothetical protein
MIIGVLIKKFIEFFFKFLFIIFISLLLFLIVDFFFGKTVVELFSNKIKDNPYYLKKQRISHPFFHHTLSPNIKFIKTGWGNLTYQLCTDQNGFKGKCNSDKKKNNYDFVFIGDSFVEGVGYEYNETFVGIFDNAIKKDLINMGVSSYSTKIYLSKIYYYIQKGLNFKHVIVFIDPADLIDDSKYFLKSNLKVQDKIFLKRIEKNLKNYFPITDYFFFIYKNKYSNSNIIYTNAIYNNNTVHKVTKGRSAWTYSEGNEIKEFKIKVNDELKEQIDTMTKLYELLKEKKIKLSIVIYPWPETIIYDTDKSIFIKTWEVFCKNKCENFINFIPIFIDINKDKELTINKYYINGDIHFNKEGHKLIGNYLIKNLKF